MAEEKLERKVVEQVVCPDCGNVMDYKDIDKYKRKNPAGLMNMDIREFVKQNSRKTQSERIKPCYLRYLLAKLFDGKLYKVYDTSDEKITYSYHKKPVTKVKDLYSLTTDEIYRVTCVGKKTWRALNEMLEKNNLPALKLPYSYTITYPSEQKAKK